MRALPALLALVLASTMPAQIQTQRVGFGKMPDGTEVEAFTLRTASGMEVTFMEYGATMISVKVPSGKGGPEEVTIRKETLDEYLAGHPLLGSTVGRFANRIDTRDTGGLVVDGKVHKLPTVNKKTGVHIHGGKTGFQKQLWEGNLEKEPARIVLRHRSPDGHEGYPGNLDVVVTAELTEKNELRLRYEATTDKATHVTMTNHVYWNLAGPGSDSVDEHVMRIHADERLEFDERKVPTGKFLPVKDTAFDFRSRAFAIGERKDVVSPYDHCYRVWGYDGKGSLVPCAEVVEKESGRRMRVATTEPGVQFYTGLGKGLCLETQHFPNSPNLPQFPSTLLKPGETLKSETVFVFDW